jgi:hypothetical protein
LPCLNVLFLMWYLKSWKDYAVSSPHLVLYFNTEQVLARKN